MEQPDNIIFTRPYFLAKNESIPDNYIEFSKIKMTIRNSNPLDYTLVYFEINNNPGNHTYSNIDIMGENEYEEPVILATFYKHSNTTFGITEILTNTIYLDKMKLKVVLQDNPRVLYNYNNTTSLQWKLNIKIFMDKEFLLNLYDTEKMPLFLFKIIKEKCFKISHDFNYKKIETKNNFYDNTNLQKTYKRTQFEYQKNNTKWMIQQEFNIKNNKTYDTFKLNKDDYIYDIPNINVRLISNSEGQILNMDTNSVKIKWKGGVLSDEVGLGKTFSMLSLVAEQLEPDNPPTLIICPPRLCTQWIEEISKTYDFKYKLIRDIRTFRKFTIDEYNKYDIILLSYKFLHSKGYIEFIENNPLENILIHNYQWERVILDEGHEYINENKRKVCITINNYLNTIPSKYRWICSGTPYNNKYSFINVLKYITDINIDETLDSYKHDIDNIIHMSFRKNTKDSVNDQVSIPKPIITTEFLDMSPLERLIYDSALDDDNKKIELCNHIMVSDEHINVLGNKPLSLEEIHEKMTLYYKRKVEKYTKRQANIKEELDKLSSNPIDNLNIIEEKNLKLEETQQKLVEVTAKYNIFSGIEEKIEEEETCPICMEELDTLTKTITPCGHIFCSTCINDVNNHTHGSKIKCAMCRHSYDLSETVVIKGNIDVNNTGPTLGTKIEHLINTIKTIITEDNTKKIIVFSQWDNMLRLVSKIFNEHEIKNIFINGSINTVSAKIRRFKIENDINVVLMSSDKSPSGLHLTEATTIILLDTLNASKEESEIIETQAIGRAVRIGQTEQVKVKRFIMRNTIEHDYYIRNIEE
mgnify:CR=1 FL=1